jgi:hypothetical protein
MKVSERTFSCEYVYSEIDYRPLAYLLAERFLQSKELKVIKGEIETSENKCKPRHAQSQQV